MLGHYPCLDFGYRLRIEHELRSHRCTQRNWQGCQHPCKGVSTSVPTSMKGCHSAPFRSNGGAQATLFAVRYRQRCCTGGTVGQPLPDPTRVPGSCTLLLWLCRRKLPGPNHGQRVATWHWIVICSPTMYSVFPPLPCNKASATLPKVSVRLQIAQA